MNRHTGETPPIAGYRLSYMTEKMECIFDGLITVTAASDQTTTPEPNMPQGPFTAAQIEAAIAVVTGQAPAPKKERTNAELLVLHTAAALHVWERGRPDDQHSHMPRAALATLTRQSA